VVVVRAWGKSGPPSFVKHDDDDASRAHLSSQPNTQAFPFHYMCVFCSLGFLLFAQCCCWSHCRCLDPPCLVLSFLIKSTSSLPPSLPSSLPLRRREDLPQNIARHATYPILGIQQRGILQGRIDNLPVQPHIQLTHPPLLHQHPQNRP